MRDITREMIKLYQINKLKYDFMGYTFTNYEQLSFHHLIVPKKDCALTGNGDGYFFWNGSILRQNTSHDYLHIIERVDRDIFEEITKCMIKENQLGKLDIQQLKRIRMLLKYFEKEHAGEQTKKGRQLIRRKYLTERIDL